MILLDTNVLIFLHTYPDRLPGKWINEIKDPKNVLVVSAASIWEIAIKQSIKRNNIAVSAKHILNNSRDFGIQILDITPDLVLGVTDLPHLHKDPFDRVIIAQAKQLGCKVMTTDKVFKSYGVNLVD